MSQVDFIKKLTVSKRTVFVLGEDLVPEKCFATVEEAEEQALRQYLEECLSEFCFNEYRFNIQEFEKVVKTNSDFSTALLCFINLQINKREK